MITPTELTCEYALNPISIDTTRPRFGWLLQSDRRAKTLAISAVDIALSDILGQYTAQPLYNLLGGRNRDRIPIYNPSLSHGPCQDARAWMEGRAGRRRSRRGMKRS